MADAAYASRITEKVAARMGRYAYWSRWDGKWLVRKNCNLAGIVYAVLDEATKEAIERAGGGRD